MTQFSQLDQQHMQLALDLAWRGRFSTSPNPRVGCVIAKGEQIIGVGFHVQAGQPHAEVHALRQAGDLAYGATAYVTLEPCAHYGRTPPCAEGLIAAGVSHVIAAMKDPNPLVSGKGLAMLQEAGIVVQSGLLETEARLLNRGFLSRMERQRPFVRVKMAASLDGKTALEDGRSQWITGENARHDVQILRAESCAVMTGIGTILVDNPRLNVREIKTIRQPIRVVLDTHFRLPENSQVVQDGGSTWLFSQKNAPSWIKNYGNLRVFRLPEKLTDVLTMLAENGIGELLVEAGATLAGALLQQDLVDEIILYQSSKILGGMGRGVFRLPEKPDILTKPSSWQTISIEALDDHDTKWVLQKR